MYINKNLITIIMMIDSNVRFETKLCDPLYKNLTYGAKKKFELWMYRTRSNYPNILIARTVRLLILFPSHFVEYAEFIVSYPFYLTERSRGVT